MDVTAVVRHALTGAPGDIKPGKSGDIVGRLIGAFRSVNSVARESGGSHGCFGGDNNVNLHQAGGPVNPWYSVLGLTQRAAARAALRSALRRFCVREP